jgi:hypothetical protein
MPEQTHQYVTDKEAELPLHMFCLQPMTASRVATRLRQSRTARASAYCCNPFYKSISRPFPVVSRSRTGEASDAGERL